TVIAMHRNSELIGVGGEGLGTETSERARVAVPALLVCIRPMGQKVAPVDGDERPAHPHVELIVLHDHERAREYREGSTEYGVIRDGIPPAASERKREATVVDTDADTAGGEHARREILRADDKRLCVGRCRQSRKLDQTVNNGFPL